MSISLHIKERQAHRQTINEVVELISIQVEQGGVCQLVVCAAISGQQRIEATLGRDAQLSLTTVDIDCAGLSRHTAITLQGEGAECQLNGLFIGRGNDRIENHTSMRHLVSNCRSDQNFRGIATDRASISFDGHIYVAPDAQQTVALQENHNIELTDTAKVTTRPELEIYADDVKCNHGATVGRRNDGAIFYMRQRGLSEADAQALLLESFALAAVGLDEFESEIIEQIHNHISETIKAL